MTEQAIFLKSFQSAIGMRWEKSLPYNSRPDSGGGEIFRFILENKLNNCYAFGVAGVIIQR